MYELIKKDIIAVLNDLVEILKSKEEGDITQIKELSNHLMHNASVFQDEDSISVAILTYSLSKIIERKQKEIDYAKLLNMINPCIANLKISDDESFRKSIRKVFDFIKTIDEKLKLYIHEVINQAQIKKGCKLCQHGISIARASEALGISQWELMRYMGETTFVERFSEHFSASK